MFGVGRNHGHIPAITPIRLVPNANHRLLAGRSIEEAVNVVAAMQLAPIHRQQILALRHVDARQRQWRSQRRRPILPVVNLRKLVAIVLDHIIRAQQPRLRSSLRLMRPPYEHVPNLNLAQHLVAQIRELRPRRQPVHIRFILRINLR